MERIESHDRYMYNICNLIILLIIVDRIVAHTKTIPVRWILFHWSLRISLLDYVNLAFVCRATLILYKRSSALLSINPTRKLYAPIRHASSSILSQSTSQMVVPTHSDIKQPWSCVIITTPITTNRPICNNSRPPLSITTNNHLDLCSFNLPRATCPQ